MDSLLARLQVWPLFVVSLVGLAFWGLPPILDPSVEPYYEMIVVAAFGLLWSVTLLLGHRRNFWSSTTCTQCRSKLTFGNPICPHCGLVNEAVARRLVIRNILGGVFFAGGMYLGHRLDANGNLFWTLLLPIPVGLVGAAIGWLMTKS